MIVHSFGVELAGLVDDLLGDRDLADVVQQGAELQVAALLGAQAELVGDREREADDALAVLAGVAVVGLDYVSEYEGGAAVGVVELQQALQAAMTLTREHGEQSQYWDEGEDVDGVAADAGGHDQGDA